MATTLGLRTASQEAAGLVREGLPFWILWLLLCVILLLIAFIFLRDKDLRQRLSYSLSGAKRRVKRTRARMRLNRAGRKKSELLRDLGRRTWSARLLLPRTEELGLEIAQWEARETARRGDLKDALDLLLRVQTEREEIRQRTRNLLKLKEAGRPFDERSIHEAREAERRWGREIREAEKRIKTGKADLKHIEFETGLRLERLGAATDQARPDISEFQPVFAQIDIINRTILGLMDQLEHLP